MKSLLLKDLANKVVVFSVTCQEENGLVGENFAFFSFFIQLKCTFLLLQHRFCIHNIKRKLQLAIFLFLRTLYFSFYFIFYLFIYFYFFFFMFCEYILENVGRKAFRIRRGIVERVGRCRINTQAYFCLPNF